MYTRDSWTDAWPKPTCCAALPGDRGQVRMNIEDPVRHSQATKQIGIR